MKTLINNDGSWLIDVGGPAPLPAALVLQSGTALSLAYQGGNIFQGAGVRIAVTSACVDGFTAISLCLDLAAPRPVDFFGLALGPLCLAAADKFFGDIPGFLERTGVMPALEAQAQTRCASLFGMVIQPGRDRTCLAGIGGLHAEPSGFFVKQDRLWAGWRPERMLSGRIEFKLLVSCRAAPLALLSDYGRQLAPLGRVGASAPTGWNSWDYYGGAISMAELRGEMAALRRWKVRENLQYLTIDMGWEEAWGNWVPNRRFPARPAQIAGRLRAAGWRPGIWLAPLQVNMFTPLARQRQDLFLRDEQDSLIIIDTDTPCGPVLLLDFSLPEVQELVRGWFVGLRQAGFELFKIDYLYTKFINQARHNSAGWGRAAFVRRIFEVIREALGDEAHIVNCGGLKEAALGLVDSSRVTVDIHNFWGHS
ncbi:MAG: hypothetical protein LC725_08350 [Lentisphaerae bacterium]|nr:hypothetical protein [Lentisphaerota bacterium]